MKRKSQDGFTAELYQINKEKLSILHKFFQKTGERRVFSNSFYKASTR
jgi:hypothetical protein